MFKNLLLISASISGAALGILLSLSGAASASEVAPAADVVEAEEALAILRHRPRLEALPQRQPQPLKTFSTTPESDALGQVTNVSELKDVEPNAWAYEALRSLVELFSLASLLCTAMEMKRISGTGKLAWLFPIYLRREIWESSASAILLTLPT
jgi:hypothetical protein